MDVENKKSALDDEASIYQKRKQIYTKDDIKDFSTKEKFRYFVDYYLIKVIIIVLVIVLLGVFINNVFIDKSGCVLNIACLDEAMLDDSSVLREALEERVTKKYEDDYVSVDPYNLEAYQFNMSFGTKLSGGAIDVVICTYDYYVDAAGAGTFADIGDILSPEEYAALEEQLVEASIVETDEEGNVVETYETGFYGIDISNSEKYQKLNDTDEQIILCVVANTEYKENAVEVIKYFTE